MSDHPGPEDTTPQARLLAEMADTLVAMGETPADAQAKALLILEKLTAVGPGRRWGGLHAEALPSIVHEAMRQGQRRLLLEIEAEGERDEWFGHLNITVKESQTWDSWEAARREAAERALN